MTPVIALLGRPNVGKSTLFNRLTRSRDALVADFPGVTRDRLVGTGRLGERPFWVVDTGGLLGEDPELSGKVSAQALAAAREADAVVLVVDGRGGLTADDRTIANTLRGLGQPVWLAVNKAEHLDVELVRADFFELGLGQPWPISSAHGHGVAQLLEAVFASFPDADQVTGENEADPRPVFAVVGRPNAGKSTLINRLLGEERLIVSDVAGTTRDPIRVPLERDGKRYTLIDTAGIRRKARVEEAVEKFSIIKTLQSISAAQVVVVMVDARENLADQDLTLIGYAMDEGRALVIAINKWDGLDQYQRDECMRALDRRLVFVDWARQVHVSALHGSGLRELMSAVVRAHASATKVLTSSDLTRTLENAYEGYQPPLVHGHAPKLRFAHPGGTNPPTIIIHGTRTKHIAPAYQRYLENFFRKRYKLEGTPIRIAFRESENPYAGRKKVLTKEQEKKARRRVTDLIKRTR